MRMRNLIASIALFTALSQAAIATTIIVDENFDSYADSTAMKAVWGGTGNLGTLDTTLSYSPNNSAAHPGGTVNSYLPGIGSATPTATQDLVLTAKIYDDAVTPGDRISVGLRTGAAPLFEMGRYLDASLGFPSGNPYGIRALSLGNGITPSPNWQPFFPSATPQPHVAGWHTYQATFSIANGVKVTLDLGSDGTIDSTLQFAGDGATAFGNFTDLRFGGPSNLTSTGGGANFDDISLALVPEPTSLLLAGLLGAVMGCMRTRR